MKKKLLLVSIILFSFTGLIGCVEEQTPKHFVECKIQKIFGNIGNAIQKHETENLKDPQFGFRCITREGIIFIVNIDPSDTGGSSGEHTIFNLSKVLEPNMIVRFPTNMHSSSNTMGFSSSNIGTLDPDDIYVHLNKLDYTEIQHKKKFSPKPR